MNHNVFITHHRIGLRLIGAYPGFTQLPGFYFAIGMMFFFLIFEIWNAIVTFNNLDKLMDNLVSTIGVMSALFKIMIFQLKHR
jgi:hypothetical protein